MISKGMKREGKKGRGGCGILWGMTCLLLFSTSLPLALKQMISKGDGKREMGRGKVGEKKWRKRVRKREEEGNYLIWKWVGLFSFFFHSNL
jgi:hypothetical protein